MSVGAVSGGNDIYSPKTYSGKDDAVQLQLQKELLQRQLEAIKSKSKNSQAEQEAAVRQKEIIERKIAEIDKKLQKISQNNQKEMLSSGNRAVNSRKVESPLNEAPEEYEQGKWRDPTEEKMQDDMFKTTGRFLDTYA